jgi:hypothetical protein
MVVAQLIFLLLPAITIIINRENARQNVRISDISHFGKNRIIHTDILQIS